ncbi:hypothetical protein G9A89_006841 [Geosiphon pyriformis]|nr:hypothetical protein G9A89_006841 [Geosiphon pyriformis]
MSDSGQQETEDDQFAREIEGLLNFGQQDEEVEISNYEKIKLGLINERLAPELLPFLTEAVDGLYQQLQTLVTKEQELRTRPLSAIKENEFIILMDKERGSYLLRNYLRTRMAKIEEQCALILSQEKYLQRLSSLELTYANGYMRILQKVFDNSFWNQLPAEMKERERDCIIQPELYRMIFCRTKKDIKDIWLPKESEYVSLKAGDIAALPYNSIAQHLLEGSIDLL